MAGSNFKARNEEYRSGGSCNRMLLLLLLLVLLLVLLVLVPYCLDLVEVVEEVMRVGSSILLALLLAPGGEV